MLDTYIALEPNVSCNHIIKSQMLSSLLENCHNPQIYEVLMNIIEPFCSKYDIFGQTQVFLWNSLLESDFFSHLVDLIIKEKGELYANLVEDETKEALNILENAEKYYSQQKTQMIKIEMVKKLGGISSLLNSLSQPSIGSKNQQELPQNLDELLGPLKYVSEDSLKENLKITEFIGKSPDIDNLKGFIQKKKPNEIKEITHKPKKLSIDKFKDTMTNLHDFDKFRITTSSLDMDKGFTSSKLMMLYPTRFLVEHVAKLDNLSSKAEFKVNSLKENEKIAFPASCLLNTVIGTMIEYENNIEKVQFLKIKRVEGETAVIDMFFHKSASNFERILMV